MFKRTFNTESFVGFLREITGRNLPRWEQSVLSYVSSAIQEGAELEQINLDDPSNYGNALQAFNRTVVLRKNVTVRPGSVGHRARADGIRYDGSSRCRYR